MADSEEGSISQTAVLKNHDPIPEAETAKENSVLENENNEKVEEEMSTYKVCSPSVSTTAKPSILKPAQLNIASSSKKAGFVLNPPKLNPFGAKTVIDNNGDTVKESNTNGESTKFMGLSLDKHEKKTNSTNEATLGSNLIPSATSTVSTTSFVFGQNLQERVIGTENEPKPSTSLNTNGSGDMLFSNAIINDVKASAVNNVNKESKSLSESAREYEQSRAVKRKYEEVEVVTGEEEETNILSISCKLFSFDGTWQERGRGTLRLNDFEADGHTQSRLVFRTSGSLRVILNTKIFAKMTAEKASDKSIRLTALDSNGEVKVFLVMASIDDSNVLHQKLEQRIKSEAEFAKSEKTCS